MSCWKIHSLVYYENPWQLPKAKKNPVVPQKEKNKNVQYMLFKYLLVCFQIKLQIFSITKKFFRFSLHLIKKHFHKLA